MQYNWLEKCDKSEVSWYSIRVRFVLLSAETDEEGRSEHNRKRGEKISELNETTVVWLEVRF